MDKPRGLGQTPVLETPGKVARRVFTLDGLSAVAPVRRWLRGVLPEGCEVRDDLELVVSELVANVSAHGGGGQITVSLSHDGGRVVGRLVHHMPSVGDLLPKWEVVSQTMRLVRGDELAPEEDLAEDSRGLLVVWTLCERFDHVPGDESSVTQWSLPPCGCGEAGR